MGEAIARFLFRDRFSFFDLLAIGVAVSFRDQVGLVGVTALVVVFTVFSIYLQRVLGLTSGKEEQTNGQ